MFAFALGIPSINLKGDYLDTFFPMPLYAPNKILAELLEAAFEEGINILNEKSLTRLTEIFSDHDETQAMLCKQIMATNLGAKNAGVAVKLNTDAAIQSTPEAYLKLHLLSHRRKVCP